jgi:hypothetical protein
MAYRKWFRGKKATVDRSAQNLRQYCKWIGKTPEQLKAEYINARNGSFASYEDWKRETKNSIVKFYNEMKDKGYSINAARTMVVGVLAFYSQNCESIRRVTKELDPIQIPENEFIFNQEVLRKCYYYGSPFEKTWLSCAVSLGYTSADLLALETEKIRNLVREAKDKQLDFIGFIGKTRTKTSVQPRSFLTPEAIANLAEYLGNLEKENNILPKRLWNNAKNDNLNDWLKALLKKSNIETYDKKVRFHGIRKFVYDVLARMDETVASVVTGKKTDVSKITYRTSIDQECERVFRESYRFLALNGDVSGKAKKEQSERVAQLENALNHLESENLAFKVRVDNLQNITKNLEDRLDDITGLVSAQVEFHWNFSEEEKEAMRKRFGLKVYSTFEKEVYRAYYAIASELQKEKGYLTPEDDKEIKERMRAWLIEHGWL